MARKAHGRCLEYLSQQESRRWRASKVIFEVRARAIHTSWVGGRPMSKCRGKLTLMYDAKTGHILFGVWHRLFIAL
jgi:hypothetical protein